MYRSKPLQNSPAIHTRMRPAGMALMVLLAGSSLAEEGFHSPHDIIRNPTTARHSICFDHSCNRIVTDSLSDAEWQLASEPLHTMATTAQSERIAIARSIARFETVTGKHIGTSADRGGNLSGMGRTGQMDCIDESTNTTTYLRLLEDAGYLHFHRVEDTATRFGLFVGMPHSTAVIRELASGMRYAVDSWFFDNGMEPYIVPLAEWKSGRDPEQ